MRKGLTEIVFILDRSGSMGGLESDTIGGFNSLINKQKNEEGEALVSTVLFDDKIEVLHDRVDIRKMKNLDESQYYVRGCTALLDAIGESIHHIGNVHKYAREEDRPEKTLFIITTDGMENASKKYSYEKIREIVERQQKKYEWQFLFLGANIDAIRTARSFGINEGCAVDFECDSEGVKNNYEALEKTVSMVRNCKKSVLGTKLNSGAWKKEIEEDYKKRHAN